MSDKEYCLTCGKEITWMCFNTEDGEDSAWYCKTCDTFFSESYILKRGWDELRERLISYTENQISTVLILISVGEIKQIQTVGNAMQEKQRETQFLLNCESNMHKQCKLQLGEYMMKFEAIRKLVLGRKYAEVMEMILTDE